MGLYCLVVLGNQVDPISQGGPQCLEIQLGLWHLESHLSLPYQEDLVIQLGLVDQFHLFVLEGLQDHEDRLDLLLPSYQERLENLENQLCQGDPLAQAFQACHADHVHQGHPVVQFDLFLLAFL